MIPNEPMYVILNTAMSSTWGFPLPCPRGCKCDCFECGNSKCECGFPPGFCKNFPNSFDIDYVRIYQAVNDTKHKLGCSTSTHPSDVFIEAHKKRYIDPFSGDKEPLKVVETGGMACTDNKDCGGELNRGICDTENSCQCFTGYTGPSCLANVGYNDIPNKRKILPVEFLEENAVTIFIPTPLKCVFGFFILIIIITTCAKVAQRRNEKYLYESIGDV
mmetsp:Transcript_14396/g.31534  ORF Transcript_14396/g.31534 Transcript_14396/m.31534 type:complete len:218 (+) Transcript_14396:1994-2647(+)